MFFSLLGFLLEWAAMATSRNFPRFVNSWFHNKNGEKSKYKETELSKWGARGLLTFGFLAGAFVYFVASFLWTMHVKDSSWFDSSSVSSMLRPESEHVENCVALVQMSSDLHRKSLGRTNSLARIESLKSTLSNSIKPPTVRLKSVAQGLLDAFKSEIGDREPVMMESLTQVEGQLRTEIDASSREIVAAAQGAVSAHAIAFQGLSKKYEQLLQDIHEALLEEVKNMATCTFDKTHVSKIGRLREAHWAVHRSDPAVQVANLLHGTKEEVELGLFFEKAARVANDAKVFAASKACFLENDSECGSALAKCAQKDRSVLLRALGWTVLGENDQSDFEEDSLPEPVACAVFEVSRFARTALPRFRELQRIWSARSSKDDAVQVLLELKKLSLDEKAIPSAWFSIT